MSVERKSRTIPTSGVIELGRGNFMLLLTALGSVNLRADRGGASEGFDGITGGILIRRANPWDNMRIIGAAGVTVEYIIGSEVVEQDETDVRLQIATIAGVASFTEAPTASLANTAAVALPNAAQTAVFPVNLLRKRISITIDSAALANVFARTTGGANNVMELSPGMTYEFKGTYGLDIRNDSGGATTAYIFEES